MVENFLLAIRQEFNTLLFYIQHMTIACLYMRYKCFNDSLSNKRGISDAISDLAELSLRSIRKVR